jgi:hypothetical protein
MEDRDHTPIHRIRCADPLWDAYGSVVKRVFDQPRSEHLIDHMKTTVEEHGNDEEQEKLAQAIAEIAERQARIRQGRPPRKRRD